MLHPERKQLRAGILLLIAASLLHAAQPARASTCLDAAKSAERRHGIPSGLLAAISQVESGGWNWSVNDNDGRPGQRFGSEQEAERYMQDLLDSGRRMIDVGCFQVDLLYHPDAFARWQDAFDGALSAEAAAGILGRLHDQAGDWNRAVSLYHSADPDRGQTYLHSVMTRWGRIDFGPADPVPLPDSDTYGVVAWAVPVGIAVWSPGMVGAIRGNAAHLPRTITP